MKPKTIAFLLPTLGGGGAERVAIRLMHSFRAAGHRVEFVLMEKKGELLDDIPADVKIVDLGATRVRNALGPLVRYFKQGRPDAVQARMWPLTVVAIIARSLAGSPARLVVSDHAVLTKHFIGKPLTIAAMALTVRLFYPKADARLAVANATADDFARVSGLPRASFDVIYNPVEEPPVNLVISPAIEAMWRDADGRIIAVGTLKTQKNHALLIRSFAKLRKRRAAKLMIVGAGELRSRLEGLVQSLGLDDSVIFVGFKSDPWPYYASADLFVLSSDYEGYPNVLVEAMRCGLAVVSTDCESGPREILAGGEFGRLVPVGDEDSLADAMQEQLEKAPSSEIVRERAKQLSGAGIAERYLDLLIGPLA